MRDGRWSLVREQFGTWPDVLLFKLKHFLKSNFTAVTASSRARAALFRHHQSHETGNASGISAERIDARAGELSRSEASVAQLAAEVRMDIVHVRVGKGSSQRK
jgi:hypothetical protein